MKISKSIKMVDGKVRVIALTKDPPETRSPPPPPPPPRSGSADVKLLTPMLTPHQNNEGGDDVVATMARCLRNLHERVSESEARNRILSSQVNELRSTLRHQLIPVVRAVIEIRDELKSVSSSTRSSNPSTSSRDILYPSSSSSSSSQDLPVVTSQPLYAQVNKAAKRPLPSIPPVASTTLVTSSAAVTSPRVYELDGDVAAHQEALPRSSRVLSSRHDTVTSLNSSTSDESVFADDVNEGRRRDQDQEEEEERCVSLDELDLILEATRKLTDEFCNSLVDDGNTLQKEGSVSKERFFRT